MPRDRSADALGDAVGVGERGLELALERVGVGRGERGLLVEVGEVRDLLLDPPARRGRGRGPARARRAARRRASSASVSAPRSAARRDPRGPRAIGDGTVPFPGTVHGLHREPRAGDAAGRGARRRPRSSATTTSPTQARTDGRTQELWDAIAELGLPRGAPPRGVRRGRRGDVGARDRVRGARRGRLPAAADPRVARDLRRADQALRHRRRSGSAGCARWSTGTKMVFAITEPDAGSNSHNIATTATRDGDVYRLNGSKTYISGVDEAGQMVVVTRTGTEPETGRGKLSLFIVDTDAPGPRTHADPDGDPRAGEAVHAVLRRRRRPGGPPARRRARRAAPGVRRAEPGTHHERVDLHRHRPLRARPRRRLRERPRGVGHADRAPPGHRPSARHRQDRGRARPA